MLVLSRRESQRIRLGDSITVTVVRVNGDKVRLGIEAPAEIRVLRDELSPHKLADQTGNTGQTGTTEQTGHTEQTGNTVPKPTSVAV